MPPITLIVAATVKNGIGLCGTLPWHIPKDLTYFSRVTTKAPTAQVNVVLMGRKTWESIPQKLRPLKKRVNIVLSRDDDYSLFPQDKAAPSSISTAYLRSDLKSSVEDLGSQTGVHRLFIIGGSSLYHEALASSSASLQVDRILMTRIYSPELECDVFFPDVLGAEWRKATVEEHSSWVGFDVPAGIQTENNLEFEYQMWVRSSEERGTSERSP